MLYELKKKFLHFLFIRSKQPVLFDDLLKANLIIHEGIIPSERLLNYRLRLGRSYLSFIILAHLFIIPVVGILHDFLASVDCHMSIILAIAFTGIFFASFTIYKEWLFESIAKQIIREAWKLHFPHFEYKHYHDKVARIFQEALNKKVPKQEMQMYILDELAKDEN